MARQAGCIVPLGDGRYRLLYRRKSKYIKAKSDREAQKLLAAFVAEVDAGDFSEPTKVTFREFAEKWLKEYVEPELSPKTIYRYKEFLVSRIYPEFGEMKLNKVQPLHIVEFYNKLRKPHKYFSYDLAGKHEEKRSEGLSDSTIRKHHRVMSEIFEKAIIWGVLKGENPFKRVDPPKGGKNRDIHCYDENEVKQLLAALDELEQEELKYKVAVLIALMTGARLGEIMGLEWQDIDTKNKQLFIRRASQYIPGQGTFTKDTKTDKSKRRVSINGMLIEALKEYKASQQSKGYMCEDSHRLFLTWDSQPMHTYTVSHWFQKFIKRTGLPALTFHQLRHTNASYLISHGVDIQTVAGRLGHATSATTQKVYSHFLQSRDRKAAELMNALKPGQKKSNKKSNQLSKNY